MRLTSSCVRSSSRQLLEALEDEVFRIQVETMRGARRAGSAPKPSTPYSKPRILNPELQTQTIHPKSSTPNPKPHASSPKPQTPNAEPQTLDA